MKYIIFALVVVLGIACNQKEEQTEETKQAQATEQAPSEIAKVVEERPKASEAEEEPPQKPEVKKLTWTMLKDMEQEEEYSEIEASYIFVSIFGSSIKPFHGEQVKITGYVVPIDFEAGTFALSRNPNETCFFCGGAGPESVISLHLNPDHRRFKIDEYLTFQGRFVLNDDDLYELPYILKNADLVEE